MIDKSTLNTFIKNTPLAMIIISLILFIIGSAGSRPNPPLQITELGWRIALAIMGSFVAGVGVLLLWHERMSEKDIMHNSYGIKIVSPKSAVQVDSYFEVTGTFQSKSSDGSVWLFASVNERYWPQQVLKFDKVTKTWSAWANIEGGCVLKVMAVGRVGRALCEYFAKVGKETGQWPSIDILTPDIVECDRVALVRK